MIGAVLLMLLFIYVSCSIEVTDAVYGVLIAFVVAEFMASLEWQIVCMGWLGGMPGSAGRLLMLLAVYGVIWLVLERLLYRLESRLAEETFAFGV